MGGIKIAIDGPSGSGKSTIARRLAGELGFYYFDTGALYRAAGLFFKQKGIDPDNEAAVSAIIGDCRIGIEFKNGEQHTFLSGEDVSRKIRNPQISDYASRTSKFTAVREALLAVQREFAAGNNIIMDGRDIGTVVLPDADVKIYLTASAEDRAKRRFIELNGRGTAVLYEAVLAEQRERDWRDTNRGLSPLRQAPDALLADTTGLEVEEGYQLVRGIIVNRLKEIGLCG